MKNILHTIFLFVASASFAQSIKISTTNYGVLLHNNEETHGYTEVDKIRDKGKYIIGIKKGYMPQAVSVDELFEKNITKYEFNLKPATKPVLPKSLKKIKFTKFVDSGNRIGQHIKPVRSKVPTSGEYGILKDNVDLKDPTIINEVNSYLVKAGFNVAIDESSIFVEKSNPSDLIIAAEIVSYDKDTRDTPGFRTSTALKWSVFDISKEKVVFTFLSGGYSNEETEIKEGEAFVLAALDAIQEFINHPDFIKLIDRSDFDLSGSGNEDVFTRISLPYVINYNLPEGSNIIEPITKSVITIKSSKGHGSGFLISSSGYILSNEHVVDDSTGLEAVFSNGISLPIKLIRADKRGDVALLKIPGAGYKPLQLDTSSVGGKIGIDVVVIGTPTDTQFSQTVTKGIVSALRDFEGRKFIQTDASVNGGNSGGPLLNKKGQVIGIVSRKRYDAEGIGFAIPIGDALKTLNIVLKN